ncbi:hypothetical protein [Streptomyces sp. SGAir0957]
MTAGSDYDAHGHTLSIADALRHSPHIADVRHDAANLDPAVLFTTPAGSGFALTLRAPVLEEGPDRPTLPETLAAAILNHPGFRAATPDTAACALTVQATGGAIYRLEIEPAPDADAEDFHSEPREEIALAAGRLLHGTASAQERAVADLLNYVANTWDKQDIPMLQHAHNLARTLLD